jgi:hypothetical protein
MLYIKTVLLKNYKQIEISWVSKDKVKRRRGVQKAEQNSGTPQLRPKSRYTRLDFFGFARPPDRHQLLVRISFRT